MNQPTHTNEDLVLVDRGQLAVLLSWAAHRTGGPVPLNAQAQLERELMAAEPPDNWFDDNPDEDEDNDPGDDDGDDDSEDVPLSSRRRAAAVAVLVCSLLVLAGAGIAWLLVVTGP